jgi:hypothetical protein
MLKTQFLPIFRGYAVIIFDLEKNRGILVPYLDIVKLMAMYGNKLPECFAHFAQ